MRTPGIYSDIKVATQRNQLPNQAHKIIFINTDVPKDIPPTDIFDTAEADAKAKPRSNAGRMMAAALAVSQGVDVEMATNIRLKDDSKDCKPSSLKFTPAKYNYVLKQALRIPKGLMSTGQALLSQNESEFLSIIIPEIAGRINGTIDGVISAIREKGAYIRESYTSDQYMSFTRGGVDIKPLVDMAIYTTSDVSVSKTISTYTMKLEGEKAVINAGIVNTEEWLKNELPRVLYEVMHEQNLFLNTQFEYVEPTTIFDQVKGNKQSVIPLVDVNTIQDNHDNKYGIGENYVDGFTIRVYMGAAILIDDVAVASLEGTISTTDRVAYSGYDMDYLGQRMIKRPDIEGVDTTGSFTHLVLEKRLEKVYEEPRFSEYDKLIFKDFAWDDSRTVSNMGAL